MDFAWCALPASESEQKIGRVTWEKGRRRMPNIFENLNVLQRKATRPKNLRLWASWSSLTIWSPLAISNFSTIPSRITPMKTSTVNIKHKHRRSWCKRLFLLYILPLPCLHGGRRSLVLTPVAQKLKSPKKNTNEKMLIFLSKKHFPFLFNFAWFQRFPNDPSLLSRFGTKFFQKKMKIKNFL